MRHAGSLVEARELSSCGVQAQLPGHMWDLGSLDQRSNLLPLHGSVESYPLDSQGSPVTGRLLWWKLVAKFCHLHFLKYLSSLSPLHAQQVTRTIAGPSSLATLFTALALSFLESMLAPAPVLFGCSQGIPLCAVPLLGIWPPLPSIWTCPPRAPPVPQLRPCLLLLLLQEYLHFTPSCLCPCTSLSLESLLNPIALMQKATHFAYSLLTESIVSPQYRLFPFYCWGS